MASSFSQNKKPPTGLLFNLKAVLLSPLKLLFNCLDEHPQSLIGVTLFLVQFNADCRAVLVF
jgi:hypothetical protein